MRDRNGFSLAKKGVGAYFNDGETISWCQRRRDVPVDASDPVMVAAVKAARKAFFRVYREGRK